MYKREARANLVAWWTAVAWTVMIGIALAGSSGVQVPQVDTTANGARNFPAITLTGVAGDLATPGSSSVWYDTTRKALRGCAGPVGIGGLDLVLTPAVADSGSLSNPTSLTAFSTKVTIPANALTAGKRIHARAWGRYTTGTALTPALNLGTRFGGSTFAASGNIPVSVSLTAQAWYTESIILIRTVGASGTSSGYHRTEIGGILGLTTPTAQVGRSGSFATDTTSALDVEQAALFTSSDASNAIVMEGFIVNVAN